MNENMTSTAARALAHASWAKTANRLKRNTPGLRAAEARFERIVDPDGTLDPAERALRAASARKAFYAELSMRAVAARRARKEEFK